VTAPRDDPYAVLGLPSGATRAQVERAYRALARELHPDTNPDPAAAEQLARVIDARRRLVAMPPRTPEPASPPQPLVPPTGAGSHRPRGATLVAGPVRIRPLPR
jgi:molecular chaperone DnaJ